MRRFDHGISTGAYEDERDDWAAAVDRARREGARELDVCAVLPPLLDSLEAYLVDATLEGFVRVSLHAPVRIDPGEAVERILRLPLDGDVILHPDVYAHDDAVSRLDGRAVFENMDLNKPYGRTVADLEETFARFPDAGFCLDVAHVWTNDRSLALGHELLDAFSGRLRQLHVSGIEPDGSHRPATTADLDLYRPLLERCDGVPWIFESVLA
jgi:hypothetical protein